MNYSHSFFNRGSRAIAALLVTLALGFVAAGSTRADEPAVEAPPSISRLAETGQFDEVLARLQAEPARETADPKVKALTADIKRLEEHNAAHEAQRQTAYDAALAKALDRAKAGTLDEAMLSLLEAGTPPRLLDRAAVIRLQVARDLVEPNFSEPPEPLPLLTSGQAQALFGETGEPFTADEAALFRQLREILENEDPAFGQPIVISPRKQRAVQAYCGRGRTILEGESAFTALDFAVSQHVLPLVNGRGEAFGRRLRKLVELIDRPLPRSARLLTRLLTVGADSYQVYRFFS